MDDLTGVGVGGIFVILVLRMVLEFLMKQRATKNGSSLAEILGRMEKTLEKIIDLLMVIREENNKVLENQKSHQSEELIKRHTREQNSLVERLASTVETLTEKVDALGGR